MRLICQDSIPTVYRCLVLILMAGVRWVTAAATL